MGRQAAPKPSILVGEVNQTLLVERGLLTVLVKVVCISEQQYIHSEGKKKNLT